MGEMRNIWGVVSREAFFWLVVWNMNNTHLRHQIKSKFQTNFNKIKILQFLN